MIELIKGDCLEKYKQIEPGSVDLILTAQLVSPVKIPVGTLRGSNFQRSSLP